MTLRALFLMLMALPSLMLAATSAFAVDCDVAEPDSLQISWTGPCKDGSWLLDPQAGCRLWDWNPAPEDTATWSGGCRAGLKQGAGTVQWFEHGRPIDRFEGAFKDGTRTSFGRYQWPAGQRFEGYYDANVPNGWGTVTIDDTSFTGIWRHGCLAHQDKVIAIGVRLSSCTGGKRHRGSATARSNGHAVRRLAA